MPLRTVPLFRSDPGCAYLIRRGALQYRPVDHVFVPSGSGIILRFCVGLVDQGRGRRAGLVQVQAGAESVENRRFKSIFYLSDIKNDRSGQKYCFSLTMYYDVKNERGDVHMDYKKIAGLCIMLGILVQVIWGAVGNAWGKSWIASCVGVFVSMFFYILANDKEKKEKK